MKLRFTLETAVKGLKAHRSRSALTVLGIVIGITAIILVMAIGKGAQSLILNQIQGMGSRTISIEPGRQPTGPSDIYQVFTDSLKERDVQALKLPANVRGNNKVAPMVIQNSVLSYENETKTANVVGGSELFMSILDVYPAEGSMFTEDDIRQRAPVVILGSTVKQPAGSRRKLRVECLELRVVPYATFGPQPSALIPNP